jgi:hypothetical protein
MSIGRQNPADVRTARVIQLQATRVLRSEEL